MLHHTSGFRDVLSLLYLSGRDAVDLHPKNELIDLVARQKALNFNPGDEYLYSNTNYFLLAEVVSRATKKPFSEFAAENIFKPLGMVHTRFYDDHTLVVPGRVPAYAPGKNGSFLVDWSTNYDNVGGGGLMSTIDDLLLWDRNFYENRLGKGTLLKEMQTRGVLNGGKQIGYALGLEIGSYRGLPTVEHSGGLFGYSTDILRFPEQRFTVVCLCSLSGANPSGLSLKVADVYLEKNLQAAPAPPEAPGAGAVSDPSQFAGKYLNRRDHSVLSFTVSGGNLVGWGASLRSIGPSRFEFPSGPVIAVDNSGGVMKVKATYQDEIFTATKIASFTSTMPPWLPTPARYSSTELIATYNLPVENGTLMLRTNWNSPLKLNPLVRDEFKGDGFGTLVFQRDADGRISGLSVFAGRIRNVTFERTN